MAGTYYVEAGDTTYSISLALDVPLSELLSANGLTASSPLFPGQALIIPGAQGTVIPITQGAQAPAPNIDWSWMIIAVAAAVVVIILAKVV